MGGEVPSRVAGTRLVAPDLAQQPLSRLVQPVRRRGQHRGELRFGDPFGNDPLRLGDVIQARLTADLGQQVGDRLPVAGQVRGGPREVMNGVGIPGWHV